MLFGASLALGLGLVGTIYGALFNQLPESRLVALSFVWFFPTVFGAYGLIGQSVARSREAPPAPATPGAPAVAVVAGGAIGGVLIKVLFRRMPPIISLGLLLVFGLMLLPLLLMKKGSALRIATFGTAMWIPVLIFFLVAVFPSL